MYIPYFSLLVQFFNSCCVYGMFCIFLCPNCTWLHRCALCTLYFTLITFKYWVFHSGCSFDIFNVKCLYTSLVPHAVFMWPTIFCSSLLVKNRRRVQIQMFVVYLFHYPESSTWYLSSSTFNLCSLLKSGRQIKSHTLENNSRIIALFVHLQISKDRNVFPCTLWMLGLLDCITYNAVPTLNASTVLFQAMNYPQALSESSTSHMWQA